jgi:hypothetical protein
VPATKTKKFFFGFLPFKKKEKKTKKMSDARNGFLATFLPFAALAAFWELVVRKHNWAQHYTDDYINFRKIVSTVLPIFLVIWAIAGAALTQKYWSERRDLRQLASKNRKYFEALPASNSSVPVTVPKDTARDAAGKISFHKLKETIKTIKNNVYDAKEYEAFLKELKTAYGTAGDIRSTFTPLPAP